MSSWSGFLGRNNQFRKTVNHLGGLLVTLETFQHPRTAKTTWIRQAMRIARLQAFELKVGTRASVVCWGVISSGMLRHSLFLS